jgi:hypothetical protein
MAEEHVVRARLKPAAGPLFGAPRRSLDDLDGVTVGLLVAAATIVAAALRFPFLSHQSLSFAEIHTRTILGRHSVAGIWDQIRATESTPPLYYYVAKLSADLHGARSAAAMRLPSTLALTAAVPVAYVALRRWAGQRAALASMAVLAVNPLLVGYATDASSNGLFVLTALLSVWGCAEVLHGGSRGAHSGWAAASVACCWSGYFGAFTVVGEALLMLALRPGERLRTGRWVLGVLVCAAPLVPVLVDQHDSGSIARMALSTRVGQTARQFAMGPNVPLSALEAAGLVVLGAAVVVGLAFTVRRREGLYLLALALTTVALPLVIAMAGIEDRFDVRNAIAGLPLVCGLAAPALAWRRGALLAAYLALATATSLWVAIDWRYEQVDWRTAIAHARLLDGGAVIATVGVDNAPITSAYLGRHPATGPVTTARLVVIVQPHRGPHDRGLVPDPLSLQLTSDLSGFVETRREIVHGFELVLLSAAQPQTISSASLGGATVYPAAG